MPRHVLGALLVAAVIPAQVAPASLSNADGNASSAWPFDAGFGRYQQIHRHVPGPVTITAIAFRRDAGTPPTGIPRWWSEFVVRMGNGVFEQATPSFTANQLTPPVEVLHRKRVVLPDWSVSSTANPRPFDFVIPLDVPYFHSGQHPLLWEIEVFDQSNVGALGLIDAFTDPVFTTQQGVAVGTACVVTLTGNASATTENQFYVWVGEWPYPGPTTPRLFVYGFNDPNLVVPELCAPLRVDPTVVIDPGFGANHGFYVPYVPAAAGLALRAQTVRLTSLPFPTSNAVVLTLPSMPTFGDRDVVQLMQPAYSSLPPGIVRGRGVVVQLL